MGMETVELVLDVEDRFGISISDADAERVLTVEDLHRLVCRLLALRSTGRCLTQPMFYRLRGELVQRLDAPRSRIRPRSHLKELIPTARRRRRLWRELPGRLATDLPPLKINPIPATLVGCFGLLCVASVVFGWLLPFAIPTTASFAIWISTAVASALLAWVISVAARPFAAEPPLSCQTIGDLARTAVLHDRSSAAPAGDVWSSKAVYEELAILIVKVLGVKPGQVTPEARFIDDFGAG